MDNKTLSAAQIRYLRIGPRANQSKVLKQQLIKAIEEENIQQDSQFHNGVGRLNKIPKYGYSQLSKTVNNFGILVNHNFGNSSSLHQLQKFGKLAKQVDNIMQSQKDKPLEDNKKNSTNVTNQKLDKRQFIKSIYNYQGQKIFVVLHSFSVQAVGENFKEILPFFEMKFLIAKVNSSKLSSCVQSALRFETQSVEIKFDKVKEKFDSHTNSEQKYADQMYKFEKIGTEFRINLPYLQFSHLQSGFKHTAVPTNKQIIDTLNEQFDNVHDLVYKYFDHEGFAKTLDPQGNQESNNNMSPEIENPNDSLQQLGEDDGGFGNDEQEENQQEDD